MSEFGQFNKEPSFTPQPKLNEILPKEKFFKFKFADLFAGSSLAEKTFPTKFPKWSPEQIEELSATIEGFLYGEKGLDLLGRFVQVLESKTEPGLREKAVNAYVDAETETTLGVIPGQKLAPDKQAIVDGHKAKARDLITTTLRDRQAMKF